MPSPQKTSDQDLSINKDNRHQYFETAIASVSDADRQIRRAEERGRQRLLHEQGLRRKIKRAMWGLLIFLVLAGVGGLALLLVRKFA